MQYFQLMSLMCVKIISAVNHIQLNLYLILAAFSMRSGTSVCSLHKLI